MLARLKALFLRSRMDRELEEEMQLHLERDIERHLERGLSREDAEFAARKGFGGLPQHAEAGHDAWGWTWLEDLGRDVRYGVRALVRSPVFTAVAVLSLA